MRAGLKIGLLPLIAVAALALSGVARAGPVTETFTGTIGSGTDGAGLFVGQNADLTGYSVTVSYSFDPALSQPYTDDHTYEIFNDYANDGAVTLSFTIDSLTQSQPTGSNSFTAGFAPPLDGSEGTAAYIEAQSSGAGPSIMLNFASPVPFSYPADQAFNDLLLTTATSFEGAVQITPFQITSFEFTLATPEPATWISLPPGFLALALMKLRRR